MGKREGWFLNLVLRLPIHLDLSSTESTEALLLLLPLPLR
jgi:hypothetical protein